MLPYPRSASIASGPMQDDDRRSAGPPAAGPYGTQFKVAIPRLPSRRAPPPTTPTSRQRDRVQRACRNCHKRKIKCSGGLPRCNYCEKTDKACVYERPRRDRLATAKDRNQALVSVLKDLSLRVSDDDKRRIEDALQDSDDEVGSPASMSSSSRASAAHQYQQHSRMHPYASSSSYVPQTVETSPTSDESPLPRLDGIIPEESGDEKGTESFEVVEAGFLGQMSEVQWLQSLRRRVQAAETIFTAPTDASISMSHPASPSFPQSPAFTSVNPNQQGALTSYHLDDEGIKLVHGGNPFELPPEHTARLLFQCFNRTVRSSFPIVPATLEGQLHQYYNLVRNRQVIQCPEKWFALVNLVFAIGAKFSHLVHAEWQADALDHIVYLSRAYQLLSINDTVFVLSTPDLSTTQAAGLLAIYYMSAGHFSRAWIMAGIAVRSAFSLGLHIQHDDDSISASRQQSRVHTWWSLHALESTLSSITGRPATLPNEEITVPLPGALLDTMSDAQGQGASGTTNTRFLDADASLHLLTQQIISNLYTQRRSTPMWSHVQQIMVSLVGELDKWAVDCIPQFNTEDWNTDYDQQRENFILKLQYYRVKILTTRPSLRRIERCVEAGTDDFTSLDQSMAEACIGAAGDVASLLTTAPDVSTLYEKGPWWSMVHNIMQALAILMNAMACAEHFRDSSSSLAHSVRQLIGWLRAMRESNAMAGRAHQIIYSIVKTSRSYVWADVADAFSEDVGMVLPQPAPNKVDPQYVPWPWEEQLPDTWFGYDLDNFVNYHYPLM